MLSCRNVNGMLERQTSLAGEISETLQCCPQANQCVLHIPSAQDLRHCSWTMAMATPHRNFPEICARNIELLSHLYVNRGLGVDTVNSCKLWLSLEVH